MRRDLRLWLLSGWLVAMLAAGCAGCQPEPLLEEVGYDEAMGVPGPSIVRRMTGREFDNAVRDLLGDGSQPSRSFPAEEEWLGFNNNAAVQQMSSALAEKYVTAAEELASRFTQDLSGKLPCDPNGEGEQPCARRFIETFVTKALRRPLTEEEVAFYVDVYASGRAAADFRSGIGQVVQVALQSPEFLYRLEEGEPVQGYEGIFKLTGWEVASRLSFFLWGSLPDDALLAAAAAGELSTPEQVEQQARRMLEDPRARDTVRDFHGQWLRLGLIDDLAKDLTAFPDWKPELRPALRAEADAFIDDVIWGQRGDLSQLFTATHTFVDRPLATYYGLPAPGGGGLSRVELPPGVGAGFLSQGGLMAALAKPNQTSPTHRGKFIREALMCQQIPPPPDNVITDVPDPDPNASARERFAQHTKEATCAGCHLLMDPIGFSFEKYDGIGRFRETEDGRAIDDSGEVKGSEVGPFRGIPELARRLSTSAEVEKCVTRNWFRYAYGRGETSADKATLALLDEQFQASGRRPLELLIRLTQTNAFRFRSAQRPSEGVRP